LRRLRYWRGCAVKDLLPTGTLRAGIVSAPAMSAFFAVIGGDGLPRGVTVDLAEMLARSVGAPLSLTVRPNSGLIADALAEGAIDVAFMPVDDERRKRVDFGPVYFSIESTYLVTAGSGITAIGEVDRPQVRVVGIANTTTIRAAGRSLVHARIVAANSVDEAIDVLRAGTAAAFALSRDSLPPFLAALPGSRIL